MGVKLMTEFEPSQIVSILGSGGAGALILWFAQRFIHTNDKKNEQLDGVMQELSIVKIHLEQIRDAVARIEGSQERTEARREREREDFIRVKAQVDAAWKAIDTIKSKELGNA